MTLSAHDWVIADVIAERVRQDEKWGQQNHPNGTGERCNWAAEIDPAYPMGNVAVQIARVATMATNRAARDGTLTWLHILREEIAEAFAEDDPVKLRRELVQATAVGIAWIEAIDRHTAATPVVEEDQQ